LLLIYNYSKMPSAVREATPSEKEKIVQKLITYVENHYMEELSMDRLAGALHLNKHYLARTFREITGVTVFNYLFQRRINEAKILFLLERDASVTEICYRVGFKSLPHFCRLFKQMVNETPEHFRRSLEDVPKAKVR
jgi:AraC-like DNA-binding protein